MSKAKQKKKQKPTKDKSAKKARVTKKWAKELMTAVWPDERDFFERPDRYQYVRKLLPPNGCVFCDCLSQGPNFESLVLAQDNLSAVIMNKYPYNTGHLLILPKDHLGQLRDLPDETMSRLAWWQKASVQILEDELKCQGFNLGLNHGSVAGAGIPEHLHWHVVPRWSGDTNFFPLIAKTKVLPETLKQTYERLRPKFAKLEKAKS